MKNNLLFILLFILNIGFSQPWKGNNAFLEDYLKSVGYDESDSADFILYRVPVKFWVYTKSDGSENVTPKQIKEFVTNLNYFHRLNKTGFRFYLSDVEYIRNDKHNILGYYWEAPLLSKKYRQPGVINVHIARNIKKGHGTVRGTFNHITQSVLIKQYTSRSSLTHEIGHYFGLMHTHHHYNRGKGKQEAVSREREFKGRLFKHGRICETNGDKLCDTPAEPRLSHCVDRNCNYTGNFHDRWGDAYKPDPANIMGYPAYRKCRTKFTRGQIAIMLYTASQDKYANYWRTTINGKPFNTQYIPDDYEPDFSADAATRIFNNVWQYHSFNSIFTGTKGSDKQDKTDYVWFRLKQAGKSKVELDFDTVTSIMPDIEVAVYDHSHNLIKKQRLSKRIKQSVLLERLPVGDYFVEIRNMGNERFSDYKVKFINK